MVFPEIFAIASSVVGGLCIFLLGMKYMSEGMQAIAGNRLRTMISAVTDNRFAACATGTVVTSLIQSSSVTTVMLVGMVNAGVMTLIQAIGVILGADLGTTITAWIVSLDVLDYGLPLLGVAGFFFLFTKNERIRFTCMMIMGIGMVFFGLLIMKDGLHPLRDNEAVLKYFMMFRTDTYFELWKCILVGTVITAIVQSSSATVAITITLARADMIGFDQAVALVLGQNIGTTITAYLACLGASTPAKRVAYAHILIKIIGVVIMSIVFPYYQKFLNIILVDVTDIAKQIAFAHTIFNICLVTIFLPFRDPLANLLIKLSPDKPHKEAPHLTFLDVRLLDTPAFGIQQSADEIQNMATGVNKMMDWVKEIITSNEENDELETKIFHREEVLDIMQKEIVEFLGHVLSGSVPHDVMEDARQQLRLADEYESISDYIANILKLILKMRRSDMTLTKDSRDDILALHAKVSEYLKMISEAVASKNPDIQSKAHTQGDRITHVVKEYRAKHLERVEKKHVPPLNSLIFTDIIASYRRIKDHAVNLAETVAGEKS